MPENKEKQAKNPGRWKPGQSGNPGGRPKELGHVRELAKKHTEEAIKTLAAMMKNGVPDRTRVAAAEAILDRGYGRPAQMIEASGLGGGPVQVEDINIRELGRRNAYALRLADKEATCQSTKTIEQPKVRSVG